MAVRYGTSTNASPCSKNCQKRHTSCHCTCEAYKTWRKELDEKREAILEQKNIDAIYYRHREAVFDRIAKRNKKY